MKVKLLRVGPIGTNCYILKDETTGKAAVIDPGDEPELIQEALEKEGVEVRYLLLTHGHYDHTGGVAGGDITQGLPRVEELFEARKPKKMAQLAEISGVVSVSYTHLTLPTT